MPWLVCQGPINEESKLSPGRSAVDRRPHVRHRPEEGARGREGSESGPEVGATVPGRS